MVNCFEVVTTNSEQILNRTVNREKALNLGHGFELSHFCAWCVDGRLRRGYSRISRSDESRKERPHDELLDSFEACQ